MQWRVTVTDDQGEGHDFIVKASARSEAEAKARDYFRKQTKGRTIKSVAAIIERRTA